jgi:hypothetical protein
MASNMGQQNELPPEFRSPPAEYASWPPAQQNEWNERRAQLLRQQAETNARNAAGKTPPPGNGRQTRPVPQPGKQPSFPKDFK